MEIVIIAVCTAVAIAFYVKALRPILRHFGWV